MTVSQPEKPFVRLPDRRFFRGLFTNYRRLLVFVKPYWRRLAVAGVIMAGNSLIGLAMPWIVQRLVDSALTQADFGLLNQALMAMVGIAVAQGVLGFGQIMLIGRVGERVVANLRKTALRAPARDAAALFCCHAGRRADLAARQRRDDDPGRGHFDDLLSLLSQSITFVGGIVIILIDGVAADAGDAGVVPLAMLGMILLGRTVRGSSKQVQDVLAEAIATAEEALAGVRIVKSFAREPYEVARYTDGIERVFGIAMRRVRVRAIVAPLIGLLAFVTIAVVLWVGGPRGDRRRLTPGQLVSFLLYTMHGRFAHRRVHGAVQPVPAGHWRQRTGLRSARTPRRRCRMRPMRRPCRPSAVWCASRA